MLDIACPRCKTVHHAGEEHIGRLLRCAGCGDAIPVTRPADAPSRATPTVLDAVGKTSPTAKRTNISWQESTRRRKAVWLGGAVVFLVLVAIAGIAYQRQQRYSAQLDKQVQDEVAKKKAQTSLGPPQLEAQHAEPTLSPDTSQPDYEGQVFRPVKDQAPLPSQQLVYTPDKPAASETPVLGTQQSSGIVRQPNRDLGIDTAEPIAPSIELRKEPSPDSAVIRTATRHSLLALMHRASKDAWYDVVDVHSGDEGWVRQADVRIHLTEHPQPAAKFSEEYVGTESAPEVTVVNQTSRMLTLRIGDASPQKLRPGENQIPIQEGILDFYATVPDAIPAQGRENFRRGYRYKWTFWIETHRIGIP